MVKHGGRIGRQEMADKLGCHRSTIWVALQAIQKHRPLPTEDFDEQREIKQTLQWYAHTEEALMEELLANDDQVESDPGATSSIGFLNVRLGLFNQIRQNRQDKIKFMTEIGLLKSAAKELWVSEKPIDKMSDDQLMTASDQVETLIKELESESARSSD